MYLGLFRPKASHPRERERGERERERGGGGNTLPGKQQVGTQTWDFWLNV